MSAIKQEAIKVYDELSAMHQHYLSDLGFRSTRLELSKKTQADLESFRGVMDQYFKISETNDRNAIAATMRPGGLVASKISQLAKDFTDQIAYNAQLVEQSNPVANKALIQHSMVLSAGATLVATLVLGIFGLLTVLNIRNRLNAMKDGMVHISENLNLEKNPRMPVVRMKSAWPSPPLTPCLTACQKRW
ncbi:hypothetical protein CWS02_11990 [Enterobacter sp. EA-1]|nr:hypothetical protein CWS02_11990 [Enterobacter sp. EA-1]